jgi:hypothetical protein
MAVLTSLATQKMSWKASKRRIKCYKMSLNSSKIKKKRALRRLKYPSSLKKDMILWQKSYNWP